MPLRLGVVPQKWCRPKAVGGLLSSLAAEAGASVRELMRRMGHSSTRAAMIYLHARDEREREIVDRLGERATEELKRNGDENGGPRSADDQP